MDRRNVPRWVRDTPSSSLHGLAWRLDRLVGAGEASDRQIWLYDRVTLELGLRRARVFLADRCSCHVCVVSEEVGQLPRRRSGLGDAAEEVAMAAYAAEQRALDRAGVQQALDLG